MDIILLIKSGMGLLVILALLIFLLFFSFSRKKKNRAVEPFKVEELVTVKKDAARMDLESLRAIVKNKKSSTKDLKEALAMILKYYGKIHPKLGMRAHPDFDVYMDVLFTICRHPNTNKDIIIKFEKELVLLNPSYKAEINEALTKGLNSRGV